MVQVHVVTVQQDAAGVRGVPEFSSFFLQEWGIRGLKQPTEVLAVPEWTRSSRACYIMSAMTYETIIGLEIHAQLLTQSKMFCRCSADYADAPPNTHVCPVCMGMPGVLPSINRRAIECTIMTALALNCTIPRFTKFDRKNYPYPDLMKGYQISQYDEPIAIEGWIQLEADGGSRRINIKRVHLEEDVAKLLHRTDPSGESYSLIDVNRAGVPLMEIVSEPDLRSAGRGPAVPDEAAHHSPVSRRLHRQHGGRQLPLRCQHQHPTRRAPPRPSPRWKSRT